MNKIYSIIIQNRTHIMEKGIPKMNGSTLFPIEKKGNISIASIKIVNTTKLN